MTIEELMEVEVISSAPGRSVHRRLRPAVMASLSEPQHSGESRIRAAGLITSKQESRRFFLALPAEF